MCHLHPSRHSRPDPSYFSWTCACATFQQGGYRLLSVLPQVLKPIATAAEQHLLFGGDRPIQRLR